MCVCGGGGHLAILHMHSTYIHTQYRREGGSSSYSTHAFHIHTHTIQRGEGFGPRPINKQDLKYILPLQDTDY